MKKILCVLLSTIIAAGTLAIVPSSVSAAKKTAAVSLKAKSATLKITKKKGKTKYGSTAIKVKSAKGVKITKTTFKSSNKKIAKVTKSGKATAVKKGKATITVKVKYTLKKRNYTKSLGFKVTVKDTRPKTPAPTEKPTEPVPPTEPSETQTEPTETETETETETYLTEPVPFTEPTETESETIIPIPTAIATETIADTEPSETETQTEPTEAESVEPVYRELNTVPEIGKDNGYTLKDADFYKKLSDFSNKLYVMSAKSEGGNYTMSPVSVFMAMSMLYSSGDEGVKSDIRELVGMDDSDIAKTDKLFKSLTRTYYSFMMESENEDPISMLRLTNTIWLNEGEDADEPTLKKLADELYCQTLETPFKTNNKSANKAVREFIKKQTNGLIDKDFDLEPSTVFALINTLYFKDIWDFESEKLASKEGDFTTDGGKNLKTDFLYGKYIAGQVQETDTCRYFYTKTAHGYKIKFILPKDGYTLKQAMTAENLNAVNDDKEFNITDKNEKVHNTRCIFPSFKISSDTPLLEIFEENNLLPHCSYFFSPLFEDRELEVSDIKHSAVIDVNDKGVEGAAVTIVAVKDATSVDPSNIVYHDFVLDKNFGFIITDPNDAVLFEGQVTNPKA